MLGKLLSNLRQERRGAAEMAAMRAEGLEPPFSADRLGNLMLMGGASPEILPNAPVQVLGPRTGEAQ